MHILGKRFEATEYEILTINEFVWSFKTFLKAVGKLFGNKMPDGKTLKLFGLKAFEIADLDNSKMLSRSEYRNK